MAKVEPIEGVELSKLVEEATDEILTEKVKSTQGLTKELLKRVFYLTEEVQREKRSLAQKEQALANIKEKIEKLIKGDWSVLENIAQQKQEEQK